MTTDVTETDTAPNAETTSRPTLTGSTVSLRPARLSSVVAMTAVVAAGLLVAWVAGNFVPVMAVLASSVALALTVRAIDHERPLFQTLGTLLAPPVEFAVVVALLLGAATASLTGLALNLVAYAALSVAVLGAVSTYGGGLGAGALSRTVRTLFVTIVPVVVVVAVAFWTGLGGGSHAAGGTPFSSAVSGVVSFAVTPLADGVLNVAVVGFELGATLLLATLALTAVPLAELASRSHAAAVERVCARGTLALKWLAAAAFGLGLVGLFAKGVTQPLPDAVWTAIQSLQVVAGAADVRLLLAGVSIVCGASVLLVWGVTWLSGLTSQAVVRRGVPLAVGLLCSLVVVAAFTDPVYNVLLRQAPERTQPVLAALVDTAGAPVLVLSLVLAVLFLFIGFAFVPIVLGGMGLLPTRTAGPALAGGGVVLVGLCDGLLGGQPLHVFAFVALGAVAWDAGEYATTLGRSVGRAAETARAELVHAGVSVVSAVAAIAVAWGVLALGTSQSAPSLPVAAFALAVIGFLLFASGLRG